MYTCIYEINVDLPSLLFGWEAEMSSQNDCKSFARNNFMSEEFNLLHVTFCRLLITKLELLQCLWDFVEFPDSCQCLCSFGIVTCIFLQNLWKRFKNFNKADLSLACIVIILEQYDNIHVTNKQNALVYPCYVNVYIVWMPH